MTRDDAHGANGDISLEKGGITRLVDDIYDYVESKTCESCKYCEVVYSYTYPLCVEDKYEPFQLHNSLKTKCNKWETK